MSEHPFSLDIVSVASPCTADWELMSGDARARHCGMCEKNVYNLSEMSRADAEALILEKEGHLCVRFYRREDGTLLTADCPVGWRAKLQRRLARGVAAVAAAMLAMVNLTGAFGKTNSTNSANGPLKCTNHWLHPPVQLLQINAQPVMIMGKMAPIMVQPVSPPQPPAPSSPSQTTGVPGSSTLAPDQVPNP